MQYSLAVFSLFLISVTSAVDVRFYKNKVLSMFYESYNSYVTNAFPQDELRPLSCDGHETFGSYSLTLVDSLDMLAITGNYSEFNRAASVILDAIDLDRSINVSVFETNIRVVGGLLSAHLFAKRTGFNYSPGWPCSGPLLDAAVAVAKKLLPAFNTKTGMPYGTVNLREGVPVGETPVTCVASVGTFLIEFGALSRLTGDPEFERVALRALYALWDHRNAKTGLVGNHVDTSTGKWTATDATIGSGVDSYFEYLAKASVLFDRPDLLYMFHEYANTVNKYIRKGDWHVMVSMETGQVTWPYFQSLESFWPGVLAITGNVNDAIKIYNKYFEIWRQYGSLPEIYDLSQREVKDNRAAYPLRPELAESNYYLYRVTRDPFYLEAAATMVDNLDRLARTPCGFATVQNVRDHTLENRMESFFLAETLKYLYLVFDLDNFINSNGVSPVTFQTSFGECTVEAGGYVFNTEAHPIDPSALYCCSSRSQDEVSLSSVLENFDFVAESGFSLSVDDVDESLVEQPSPPIVEPDHTETELKPSPTHPDLFSVRPLATDKQPLKVTVQPEDATLLTKASSNGVCSNPSQLDVFLTKIVGVNKQNKMCSRGAESLLSAYNALLRKAQEGQQATADASQNSIVEALQGWLSLLSTLSGPAINWNVTVGDETATGVNGTATAGGPNGTAIPLSPHFVDPCAAENSMECYAAYEVLFNRPAFVCLPVPFYVRHLGIHGVQFYDTVQS